MKGATDETIDDAGTIIGEDEDGPYKIEIVN